MSDLALDLCFFFFNDTGSTEIYTLSLHDALPISLAAAAVAAGSRVACPPAPAVGTAPRDRKSTRLNSSHVNISYAVFCLKKKKQKSEIIKYKKKKKKIKTHKQYQKNK